MWSWSLSLQKVPFILSCGGWLLTKHVREHLLSEFFLLRSGIERLFGQCPKGNIFSYRRCFLMMIVGWPLTILLVGFRLLLQRGGWGALLHVRRRIRMFHFLYFDKTLYILRRYMPINISRVFRWSPIWVSFCRAGILAISCHIFSKSRTFVWPNRKR